MEKINFVNNSQPAINDTNLNKLQQNVENAIQEVQDVADDLDTNKLDKTSIKDTYSTSATDTYSCNYINEKTNLTVYGTSDISSWLIYNWETNGVGSATKDNNGLKTLQLCIRNGTNQHCIQLPTEMKSILGTRIIPVSTYSANGYAFMYSDGTISISDNIFTSGTGDLIINISYY